MNLDRTGLASFHYPRASSTHDAQPARGRRSRPGFTLAELIVAVALLTIGLGALASTSSYLLYETASSRRAERGANVARSRLELLRLGPCASATGTASHQGLTERWSVSAVERSAVTEVWISYVERGGEIVQHYRSAFAC